jgi:hypothetical protein
MRREGPHTEKKETGKAPGKHPDEDDGGKEHTGDKDRPESRENPALGSSGDRNPVPVKRLPGKKREQETVNPVPGKRLPGKKREQETVNPVPEKRLPGKKREQETVNPVPGKMLPATLPGKQE